MPVYQYACTSCAEQLEVRQSFTDDALTVCPACGGRLRKVLNAVGVVFKGSGFYRTDSRAAAASAAGASAEAGTTTSGSDGSRDGNAQGSRNGVPAKEPAAGSGAKEPSGKPSSGEAAKGATAQPGSGSAPRPSGGGKPAPAAAR